jgi:hypothetical protein
MSMKIDNGSRYSNSAETCRTVPSRKPEEKNVEFTDLFTGSANKKEDTPSSFFELYTTVKTSIQNEQKTRQYADGHGRIKHLALNYTSYAGNQAREQMKNAYKIMFKEMEPDTKFTIAINKKEYKDELTKMIKDENIPNPERFNFILPEKSKDLTIWARDMMLCTYDPEQEGKSVIVQQTPLHDWHLDDKVIPKEIAASSSDLGYLEEPRMVTDGGDVASNTEQSFVGYRSIAATAHKLSKMAGRNSDFRAKATEYYEDKHDKQVVHTSEENMFPFKLVPRDNPEKNHQVGFDLDNNPHYKVIDLKENQVREGNVYEDLAEELFETTLGKPIMILGKDDPETTVVEGPASDHLDMAFSPIDDKTCFVGDPTLTARILSGMSEERLEEVEKILNHDSEGDNRKLVDLKSVNKHPKNHAPSFDYYAKQLEDKGYNVVRLPNVTPKSREPYVSYTNCLIENFEKDGEEVRRVFLPTYGIEELDKYAINAFEEQGFEVHDMQLDWVSRRWGALRCISNWPEKSPQG